MATRTVSYEQMNIARAIVYSAIAHTTASDKSRDEWNAMKADCLQRARQPRLEAEVDRMGLLLSEVYLRSCLLDLLDVIHPKVMQSIKDNDAPITYEYGADAEREHRWIVGIARSLQDGTLYGEEEADEASSSSLDPWDPTIPNDKFAGMNEMIQYEKWATDSNPDEYFSNDGTYKVDGRETYWSATGANVNLLNRQVYTNLLRQQERLGRQLWPEEGQMLAQQYGEYLKQRETGFRAEGFLSRHTCLCCNQVHVGVDKDSHWCEYCYDLYMLEPIPF